MTSPRKPKAAEPLRFERWLRIECPDKDCKGWTFIPENKLPDLLVCVVCRVRTSIKDILKKGLEFKRR